MKITIFKTMTLIAICLFSMNSHAQTKEETINWLKEKLNNCIEFSNQQSIDTEDGKFWKMISSWIIGKPTNKIQTIHIDECNIEIKLLVKNIGGTSELVPITMVFPTSGIKVHKNGWFLYSTDIGHYTVDGKEYYVNIIPQLNIRNKEENIYERLQTALDHLATFCPKKKETF